MQDPVIVIVRLHKTRDSRASRQRKANGEDNGCEGNDTRQLAGLFLPVVVGRHAIIAE